MHSFLDGSVEQPHVKLSAMRQFRVFLPTFPKVKPAARKDRIEEKWTETR